MEKVIMIDTNAIVLFEKIKDESFVCIFGDIDLRDYKILINYVVAFEMEKKLTKEKNSFLNLIVDYDCYYLDISFNITKIDSISELYLREDYKKSKKSIANTHSYYSNYVYPNIVKNKIKSKKINDIYNKIKSKLKWDNSSKIMDLCDMEDLYFLLDEFSLEDMSKENILNKYEQLKMKYTIDSKLEKMIKFVFKNIKGIKKSEKGMMVMHDKHLYSSEMWQNIYSNILMMDLCGILVDLKKESKSGNMANDNIILMLSMFFQVPLLTMDSYLIKRSTAIWFATEGYFQFPLLMKGGDFENSNLEKIYKKKK
jgi:hypothetical protein